MEENLEKQDNQSLTYPVSRAWLESLSTGELIKLADTYGIDIPSGLERIFIIEEILECANADSKIIKEEIVVNPSYSEAVLLPKQYNISYVEVIIRDPLWVFAFWEIKGHDREMYENSSDFNGYNLRVIPLNEGDTEQNAREKSFTVSVDANDCARYLGFAEHMHSGRYVIKLGVLKGESEIHIASSLPFNLPKLYDNEIITNMSRKELIRLSGIQDLAITKNADRQSRVKRQ